MNKEDEVHAHIKKAEKDREKEEQEVQKPPTNKLATIYKASILGTLLLTIMVLFNLVVQPFAVSLSNIIKYAGLGVQGLIIGVIVASFAYHHMKEGK